MVATSSRGDDDGMTWVTIRGAMKYLHISHDAIMCAIKQGAIHAYRKPSASMSPQISCLISTDELDDWVRSWDEWEERTLPVPAYVPERRRS